uniref:TNFR-Cys domain-containing protein n=1 Tax=Macrostomum lignano TaxID=282301 RepID=A0A1I8FFP0_9PLAT
SGSCSSHTSRDGQVGRLPAAFFLSTAAAAPGRNLHAGDAVLWTPFRLRLDRGLLFYLVPDGRRRPQQQRRRRGGLNRWTTAGTPGCQAHLPKGLAAEPARAFCTSACGGGARPPACYTLRAWTAPQLRPLLTGGGARRGHLALDSEQAGCTGCGHGAEGRLLRQASTARTGGPSGTWAGLRRHPRWAWRSSRTACSGATCAPAPFTAIDKIRGQPLKLVLPPEHSGSVLSAVVYHSVRQALGGQAGSRRCTLRCHICIQAGGSPVCLCDQLSVMKDGVCVPSGDAGRKPGRKQPEPVAARDGSDAAAGQQQSLRSLPRWRVGPLLCLAAGAALAAACLRRHRRLNASTEATGLPKIN